MFPVTKASIQIVPQAHSAECPKDKLWGSGGQSVLLPSTLPLCPPSAPEWLEAARQPGMRPEGNVSWGDNGLVDGSVLVDPRSLGQSICCRGAIRGPLHSSERNPPIGAGIISDLWGPKHRTVCSLLFRGGKLSSNRPSTDLDSWHLPDSRGWGLSDGEQNWTWSWGSAPGRDVEASSTLSSRPRTPSLSAPRPPHLPGTRAPNPK